MENCSSKQRSHSTSEKFENATTTGHFGRICLRRKLGQGNNMIIVTSSSLSFFFDERRFQSVSSLHEKSVGLKSLFENRRFRDGLVCTIWL